LHNVFQPKLAERLEPPKKRVGTTIKIMGSWKSAIPLLHCATTLSVQTTLVISETHKELNSSPYEFLVISILIDGGPL